MFIDDKVELMGQSSNRRKRVDRPYLSHHRRRKCHPPTLTASPSLSPQMQHACLSRETQRISLRISGYPPPRAPPTTKHKLFKPETDSIPMRHSAEPKSVSDTTSSLYAHVRGGPSSSGAVHQREAQGRHQRQLFDPRKDEPVRFAVMARPSSTNLGGRPAPTPKTSAD